RHALAAAGVHGGRLAVLRPGPGAGRELPPRAARVDLRGPPRAQPHRRAHRPAHPPRPAARDRPAVARLLRAAEDPGRAGPGLLARAVPPGVADALDRRGPPRDAAATVPSGMPQLTPSACRVLGVLVEKAQTGPAQYPMTLNALVVGANQKNN